VNSNDQQPTSIGPNLLCGGQSQRVLVMSYSAVNLFWKHSNLSQPVHGTCTLQKDRRTDGQTDDILWHHRATRSMER